MRSVHALALASISTTPFGHSHAARATRPRSILSCVCLCVCRARVVCGGCVSVPRPAPRALPRDRGRGSRAAGRLPFVRVVARLAVRMIRAVRRKAVGGANIMQKKYQPRSKPIIVSTLLFTAHHGMVSTRRTLQPTNPAEPACGDTHTTRSPRTVHGARRRTDTTMCAARLAAVCGLARHRPRAYAATRQHTGTSHAHDPRAIITTPLTSQTSSSTRRKPTPDAAVTIGLKASHAVCTPVSYTHLTLPTICSV